MAVVGESVSKREPGLVALVCNPGTLEAEAGTDMSLRLDSDM